MTKFDESWSGKARRIGTLERGDHFRLTEEDRSFFFGEYTARAGFAHSSTNGLISNLKKKPSTKGTAQWSYKLLAIQEVAAVIKESMTPANLASVCFVPMPPSKTKDHPEYDDRMENVAAATGASDVRPILYSVFDREARHETTEPRDPDELRVQLQLNPTLIYPVPTNVILLDDMVTTGCGLIVAKEKLRTVWPDAKIVGLFVARRVLPKPDLSAFADPVIAP